MTLEEALDKIASYKPRARATHEAVYAGYLTARQKKRLMGSTAPVTREEVRVEYGGNSTGTVSKYMLPIEIIEASKQEKAQAEPAQPQQDAQAKALPTGMQKVFDAIRTALDALPAATSETITALSAEQSARYQAVLDQQKLSAEATLREATDRIADLESASYGAGEESEEHQWQAEELRTALNAAAAERDSFASSLNTAKAEVQALKSEHDMDRAKIGYLEQNNPTDVYVDALLRNDAAPAPSPQASAGNLFATRAELGRLMASGTRSPSTASVLWKRRSPASLPGFLSSTAG